MKFAPLIVVLLVAGIVSAQSVADAARVERERRARLAHHAPEVTNDDLKRPTILPEAAEPALPLAATWQDDMPALNSRPFTLPAVPLWKVADQPGFSLGEYARELRRLKAEREALARAPLVKGPDGALAVTQPAPQPKPERAPDPEQAPVPVRAAEVRETSRKPARVGRASQQREFPRRPRIVPQRAELAKAPAPAAQHHPAAQRHEESAGTAAPGKRPETVPASRLSGPELAAKRVPEAHSPLTPKQEKRAVAETTAKHEQRAHTQRLATAKPSAPRVAAAPREARTASKPQAPVSARHEQPAAAMTVAARQAYGAVAKAATGAKRPGAGSERNAARAPRLEAKMTPQPQAAIAKQEQRPVGRTVAAVRRPAATVKAAPATAPRLEAKAAPTPQTPKVAKHQERAIAARLTNPARPAAARALGVTAARPHSGSQSPVPHASVAAVNVKRARQEGAKAPAARAVTAPRATAAAVAAPIPVQPERTIVVARGDSLWKLAAIHLGRAQRWAELWKANPQLHNPDLIHPGDVLYYSEADAAQAARASVPRRTKTLAGSLSAKLGG